MMRLVTGVTFLLWLSMLCSQAQATHIQYVDVADITDENGDNVIISSGDEFEWTFDLLNDDMYLWEIDSPYVSPNTTPDVETADYIGSYDLDSLLHYVTLRIDPNNFTGDPTSTYIELKINDVVVEDWTNPISIYDWGVPGDPVTDLYDIVANDYTITVTLTGLTSLDGGQRDEITIDNVNIEGCFDTTPVPEPATMLLFGAGLAGIVGSRIRRKKT